MIMNKKELFRDVMTMVNNGLSILDIVDSMEDWEVVSISTKSCTLSKRIDKKRVSISVFIGKTIKDVEVF